MKFLVFFIVLIFSTYTLKAQRKDFEIKVVSTKYQNVRGKLQVVNKEGIAIEDYKGNYLIFKANEIIKLKIKKRGLTFGEAIGTGTLSGLAIGAAIWSIDDENQSFEDMAKLTGLLTASGAIIGTITGLIAEITHVKLILTLDGNVDKFTKNYQKLEKFVEIVPTYHVN